MASVAFHSNGHTGGLFVVVAGVVGVEVDGCEFDLVDRVEVETEEEEASAEMLSRRRKGRRGGRVRRGSSLGLWISGVGMGCWCIF